MCFGEKKCENKCFLVCILLRVIFSVSRQIPWRFITDTRAPCASRLPHACLMDQRTRRSREGFEPCVLPWDKQAGSVKREVLFYVLMIRYHMLHAPFS